MAFNGFSIRSVGGLLALAGPPPPVGLIYWKSGIFGLSDSAAEGVEDAGVLADSGHIVEALVETVAVGAGELSDGMNAEGLEIAFDGLADSAQVAKGS